MTIDKMATERDHALARAAAAAMEVRERAANVTVDMGTQYDGRSVHYHIPERVKGAIRALPIDPDAQEALDNLLSKAREDAIREAADIVNKNRDISGWVSHDAILALLNDGGQP